MKKSIQVAAVVVLSAFIGLVSRWHGGAFLDAPKLLKAFVWSVPLVLCSVFAVFPHTNFFVCVFIATSVLAWSMVFKQTGHGGGFDLGHSDKEPGAGRDPEKLEYLILWLHGKMPRYWYDFLMMSIIGVFSTAGAAIAVGWYYPAAGVVIGIGGLLKAPAYAIGWVLDDAKLLGGLPETINHPTAIGEVLTGVSMGAAVGIAALMIL